MFFSFFSNQFVLLNLKGTTWIYNANLIIARENSIKSIMKILQNPNQPLDNRSICISSSSVSKMRKTIQRMMNSRLWKRSTRKRLVVVQIPFHSSLSALVVEASRSWCGIGSEEFYSWVFFGELLVDTQGTSPDRSDQTGGYIRSEEKRAIISTFVSQWRRDCWPKALSRKEEKICSRFDFRRELVSLSLSFSSLSSYEPMLKTFIELDYRNGAHPPRPWHNFFPTRCFK